MYDLQTVSRACIATERLFGSASTLKLYYAIRNTFGLQPIFSVTKGSADLQGRGKHRHRRLKGDRILLSHSPPDSGTRSRVPGP